jgi:PST family polysaccharide transporter
MDDERGIGAVSTGQIMTAAEIKERAVKAVKWTALAEIASRAAQPLVTLVLARLLSPNEFGIVGVAIMVISFSQVFWEAGLSRALIQTESDSEQAANVVFWTNIALSVLVYMLLFFVAPTIGSVYHDATIAPVLRVLGLQVVILAFASVQNALFQRGLNFKVVFWARLATSLLPGFVSIPLALQGYGVWALVGGTLVGTLTQVVILWILSPWRPARTYNFSTALKLGRFGFWVALEAILGWFYNWADSMLLGAYLGVRELGLYRTGTTVVMLAFGVLLNPILPVLYSSLCRFQNDLDQLRQAFSKAARLTITVALPVSVGLFILGERITDVLFGDKWVGLGQVVAFIALVQGWSWFVAGSNFEAYRAIGRPDVFPKLMAFALVYYLPVYFFAAPRGLEVFLWARLCVSLVSLPIHIWLIVRILGLSPLFLWNQSRFSWFAVGVMGVLIYTANSLIGPHYGRWTEQIAILGFLIGLGGMAYTAVLAILDRKFVREVRAMVLQAIEG